VFFNQVFSYRRDGEKIALNKTVKPIRILKANLPGLLCMIRSVYYLLQNSNRKQDTKKYNKPGLICLLYEIGFKRCEGWNKSFNLWLSLSSGYGELGVVKVT
jgi:hypothetical protein